MKILIVPNEDLIRETINKIDGEYDLESRFNRYKNLSPDLIELASEQGLTDINDAVRALFVADFIVTSSEIPSEGTDNDRYRSLIHSFKLGQSRCSSSDSLMRIFYLAYKTATMIRRQDLFMAGRGLSRKTALIRLKDCYITPYLKVAGDVLGTGSSKWELSILSSALFRTYPDEEFMGSVSEHTDQKSLTANIWNLLDRFSKKQAIETNPNVVIPNVKESQSLLLFDAKQLSLISLWNNTPSNLSNLKSDLRSLTDFLKSNKDQLELISIRGLIVNTMEKFFIVRSPYASTKPLFIMKTSSDEINLSKVLNILHLRGLEKDGWKPIIIKEEPAPIPELKPEISPIVTPKERPKSSPTIIKETVPKKKGLLSNLKSKLFGKKEQPISEERPVTKIPVSTPPKKVKKEKKGKRGKVSDFSSNSGFLAHGLTVDAVGDLDLYDQFDTSREASYNVIGTFDNDFSEGATVFLSTNLVYELISFLTGLYQILQRILNNWFSVDYQILLEEVFLVTNDGEKQIVCLSGNQDRVVGTIASSASEKIVAWETRKEEKESLQRRSLHMRTSQLLAARRHTPFDEAVERIYGENMNIKTAEKKLLDHTIFSSP
ncbi:MAG: hypothetical protein ACXAC8_09325 [Candidatus Hodarchaeales archaeon]